MKIMLTTLNSKYVHMNLAIRYLYEAAIEFKDQIMIKEFTINNDDDYIFTELVLCEAELICFSCYIWNIERILSLAANLKKAKPELRIVLGGPEVSYDQEAFLQKHPYIDLVIQGEGELAFHQLCNDFLTMGALPKAYLTRPMEDFEIPFPYGHLTPEKDKTVYYESSRGCPYRCAYCLSSIQGRIRGLPVDRVKGELLYFLSEKVRQVKFVDRTFNWNDERCCDIIKFLMENDNGVTNFHFEMCGELISDRLIQLLEKARVGQFQLEIGIQSTHAKTLEAVNRTGKIEAIRTNVEKIKRPGNVHIHLDLIVGLPHEGFDTFKTSFNQVYELAPDALQVGFLKMLKGTLMREMGPSHGYLYREKAPYEVVASKYMTGLEMARLKQFEKVVDLYYNKGGFSRSLQVLLAEKEGVPFDFYEALALYYHQKGHQHKSHKKEDLYRILLGYAEAAGQVTEEMKALLLLDMKDMLNAEAVKNFERKGFNAL